MKGKISVEIPEDNDILSNRDRDMYLCNIFKKQGKFDPLFLYMGKGNELYSKLETKDGEYKFYSEGLKLIEENKSEIRKYIGKTFIDRGCGNGDKAAIVLSDKIGESGRNPVSQSIDYIPADYSSGAIQQARMNLESKGVHVKDGLLFLDGNTNNTSIKTNKKITYFFVGGTIGNFDDEKISKMFTKMGNSSWNPVKGNNLIFDYFSAPTSGDEIKDIMESYTGSHTKARFENGLKTLGIDNLENFEFKVRYVGSNLEGTVYAETESEGKIINLCSDIKNNKEGYPGYIEEGFEAKKDTILGLSDGGKILIKKGDFYPIERSRRFSEEEINKYLEKSGYKREKTKFKQGKLMKLGIATKKGESWQKNRGFVKKLTGATLLVALGAGTNQFINNQIEKNKRNQIENSINRKRIDVGYPTRPFEAEEAFYEQEGYYEPLKQEMLSILWDVIDRKNMSENDIKDVELMFIDFFKHYLRDISKQDLEKWNESINNEHAYDFLTTPISFYGSCEKKDMINLVYKFINNNIFVLKSKNCGLVNREFENYDFDAYYFDDKSIDLNKINDNINSLDYNIKIRVTGEECTWDGHSSLQDQTFKPVILKKGDHVLDIRVTKNEEKFYTTESGDTYLIFFTKLRNDDGGEKWIMLASLINEKNIVNIFKENITKSTTNIFNKPFSYTFSTDEAKIVLNDFLKRKQKIENRPDIFPNTYSNYLKSVEDKFKGIAYGLMYYDSDMWNVSLFGDKHVTLSYDFVKSKEEELVRILRELQKDYNEIGKKEYKIYNDQQKQYISLQIKPLKDKMQEVITMCSILQYDIRLEAEKLGLKLDLKDHNYYQNKINELGLNTNPIKDLCDDGGYYKLIKE